ncbi:hypothetical protein GcM3_112013b [Golovinomyces cichoracearum]|uniref:Uncharacterized protein n=1 Tax=Golovinomyces cichoracearum TaxID=62708 RepID=A0A420I8Q3_9PEZI|nr:hypothetical protein GcM3_112013b [Golovinomyces cichoracearum]
MSLRRTLKFQNQLSFLCSVTKFESLSATVTEIPLLQLNLRAPRIGRESRRALSLQLASIKGIWNSSALSQIPESVNNFKSELKGSYSKSKMQSNPPTSATKNEASKQCVYDGNR